MSPSLASLVGNGHDAGIFLLEGVDFTLDLVGSNRNDLALNLKTLIITEA